MFLTDAGTSHNIREILTLWSLQMLYSPDHSGSAIWQVYLQAKKYEMTFPNIELQIWRLQNTRDGTLNILQQVTVGATIDACNGGLGDDPAHPGVTDSEQVKKGSTNLNVEEAIAGSGASQKFR